MKASLPWPHRVAPALLSGMLIAPSLHTIPDRLKIPDHTWAHFFLDAGVGATVTLIVYGFYYSWLARRASL
jgi:uncharacterized membrane protein